MEYSQKTERELLNLLHERKQLKNKIKEINQKIKPLKEEIKNTEEYKLFINKQRSLINPFIFNEELNLKF